MKRKILAFFISSVLSIGSYAQETMTVVSEGVGSDVESAIQNAAETALIQVVGSFIDSSKAVEKYEEIRNGVRTKTKNITVKKISEYSQGVIHSIEVLSVDKIKKGETTLYFRATAKVTVRMEDFKNYIKQTVFAEKKVRKGLLSKMKIKKKQKQNLSELINNVVKDIASTKVIIPVIDGEMEEVTDLHISNVMDKLTPGEGYVVKIPVKSNFNPSFLENSIRIFDETAVKKFEGYGITEFGGGDKGRYFKVIIGDFVYAPNRSGNMDGFIRDKYHFLNKNKKTMVYVFSKGDAHKLCNSTMEMNFNNAGRGGEMSPDIELSFISETGKILRNEMIVVNQKYKRSHPGKVFHYSPFSMVNPVSGEERKNMYASMLHKPASMLGMSTRTMGGGSSDVRCQVTIDTENKYNIITKVSEDILANTDRIKLSYHKSDNEDKKWAHRRKKTRKKYFSK